MFCGRSEAWWIFLWSEWCFVTTPLTQIMRGGVTRSWPLTGVVTVAGAECAAHHAQFEEVMHTRGKAQSVRFRSSKAQSVRFKA